MHGPFTAQGFLASLNAVLHMNKEQRKQSLKSHSYVLHKEREELLSGS